MAERPRHKRVSTFRSAADLRAHCAALGVRIPCDDEVLAAPGSPLAQPIDAGSGLRIGNRFAIQPMEGWDGTGDGRPTDLVRQRWRNFGISGAKLIWGGEACAVCPEGRANPNQLICSQETAGGIAELHGLLRGAHRERFGSGEGLVAGLQLTHSGRFCRPFRKDRSEPVIAYRHPILDRRFGIDAGHEPVSDDELHRLIELYVSGARVAGEAGFDFVDVKHCHGYLGHELLSGFTRPGEFGGSFENRTRFLRGIVEGIRADQGAGAIAIGVRLSAFDWVPFRPDPGGAEGGRPGPGIPEPYEDHLPYRYGFGTDSGNPAAAWDLTETFRFLDLLRDLGIRLVNLSCGSPYYNPHIQRPALFPPSDGYQPPEDPLVGVARQLAMVGEVKARHPDMVIVGSGYSYLQEYVPHAAQALVRAGEVDLAGLGRMVLAYPDLPADVLGGRPLARKRICRTFSDCTTAPRNGMISGCFPLDPNYKALPEAAELKRIKASAGAD